MTIATETRTLIEATLDGDPELAKLTIAGASAEALAVHIAPGLPPNTIGGSTYHRRPPFRRETILDLVVRMQRLRWRRAAPLTPLAMPPVEADLHALHQKHKRATVGFEYLTGWIDLLDAPFTWLDLIASDRQWAPDQIKEKYGTLRFYWHGDLPDLGDAIIASAEHLSGHVCEMCGAPGSQQSWNGWWSTTCPDHGRWRLS
jgi:hypothetical protein